MFLSQATISQTWFSLFTTTAARNSDGNIEAFEVSLKFKPAITDFLANWKQWKQVVKITLIFKLMRLICWQKNCLVTHPAVMEAHCNSFDIMFQAAW